MNTATVTETPVPMGLMMTVVVYNSAGEAVLMLFSGNAQGMPTTISYSDTSLLQGDSLLIDYGTQLSNGTKGLIWTGISQSGQEVGGGIYSIKTEFVDSFGKVTEFVQQIQILMVPSSGQVTIYNSAGEEVYAQALSTANGSVTGLELENNVLVLDGTGLSVPIKGTLHSSAGMQPWTWNGINSSGAAVNPGVYMIHVYAGSSSKMTSVSVKQISVILNKNDGLAGLKPYLAPNPVQGSQGISVIFEPGSGSLRGRIYSLAGELVSQAAAAGSSGRIEFKPGGLTSGIYLVLLDYLDGNGRASRAVLKLVILR